MKDSRRVNPAWREASDRMKKRVAMMTMMSLRRTSTTRSRGFGGQGAGDVDDETHEQMMANDNNNHDGDVVQEVDALMAEIPANIGEILDRNDALIASIRASSRTDEEALIFHGFREDDEMRRRGVAMLESAMALAPETDRAAYDDAVRTCPELVATETDPVKFLRFEHYNEHSAAVRLATYWRLRLQVYGADRCFLPLRIMPNDGGAIRHEDLEGFLAGAVSVLPVSAHESHRTVMYADRAKLIPQPTRGARAAFFALHHVVMELNEHHSRTKGMIFLDRVDNLTGTRFNQGNLSMVTQLIQHGLPVKGTQVFVISRPNKSVWTTSRMFIDSVLSAHRNIMRRFLAHEFMEHAAKSDREALDQLLRWGFKRDGLPQAEGGSLTPDDMRLWLRECGYDGETPPHIPDQPRVG